VEPLVNEAQRARTTYFWDRFRGAGQGLIETCWRVFALLVAIRVFDADESLKQFIPAGLGLGFLLSPIGLSIANSLRLRISTIIAFLWCGVALGLAGMILSPSILPFVICVAFAQVSASQVMPMMTHLYSENYPPEKRGSWLSTTFLIASFIGIGFGYLGGKLLDWDVSLYPLVFGTGIFGSLLAAWSSLKIPSEQAHTLQSRNPLTSMRIAGRDRLFVLMLVAWMLMGIGNLMSLPLRVEYIANPRYGINASNAQVSALLVSTVLTFRLLSTKVWGFLFDRVNVVGIRVTLNLFFMGSLVFFFFTTNLWVMAIGCALLGMAFGGGGILWSLYVTKIAPPEQVAAYMSVHSFLTGVRMVLAPIIGYAVMEFTHPTFTAWIALLLIGLSTLIFIPLKSLLDQKAVHLETSPEPRMDGSRPNFS
jgi:MFS family permease